MKRAKASRCATCNLRCAVKYPGKKVPYSEENCPVYKDGNKPENTMKRMPQLTKFNEVCVEHNIKPIIWM